MPFKILIHVTFFNMEGSNLELYYVNALWKDFSNWFWHCGFLNKVLDKAEYLRDMEANLLPGFLRLQELVSDVWIFFPYGLISRYVLSVFSFCLLDSWEIIS